LTIGFITELLPAVIVDNVGWVVLLAFIGGVLVYFSRDQPFPEISRKHGLILLSIAGLLWISAASPRQFDQARVAATIVTIAGGFQMLIGAWHIAITNRDVIVGPLAGVLLCVGTGALFAEDWAFSSTTEQGTAFVTLSILILLEVYLFFKGMIVGTTARMWSAAGLRQVERGLLSGKRGAIGNFERAWDFEEEYINAMSHLALTKIHSHLGNNELASEHHEKLQRLGGEESMDSAWIDALETSLSRLKGMKSEE